MDSNFTLALQKYLSDPGVKNLGGGLPNPASFPISSMSLTLSSGEIITVPQKELQTALQYGQTQGSVELLDWIRTLQKELHSPMVEFDTMLGNGSQDLIAKAFEMLLDPSDTLLIESPTYVGILAFLKPLDVEMTPIEIDRDGISADKLKQTLQEWPADKKRPRVLYTVPTGGNPSGVTTTITRKKEILDICSEYDIILLEDDPYYYIQYPSRENTENSFKATTQSYLSLDTDGRVLRFDSFSKILTAGARLGFVTGPKQLLDGILLHQMATLLQPSSISQVVVYNVLKNWGLQGFLKHVYKCGVLYQERRNFMVQLLEKYLTGLATWNVPTAGMFVWLDLKPSNVVDAVEFVKKAVDDGVLVVPGDVFYPTDVQGPFIRASYSHCDFESMEEAVRRLGMSLKRSQ